MVTLSVGTTTQAESDSRATTSASVASFSYEVISEFQPELLPAIPNTQPFLNGASQWVAAPNGDLYGIAGKSIIRWSAGGFDWLRNFTDAQPSNLMIASDGNIYGSTDPSAIDRGTIFRLTLTGEIATLHAFSGTDGSWPSGPLVQGSDGYLYGSTLLGGVGWVSGSGFTGGGTIFRLSLDGEFATVAYFRLPVNVPSPLGLVPYPGAGPVGPLAEGEDGNFYGTTYVGGSVNKGTIFRFSPLGSPANPTSIGILTDIVSLGVNDVYNGYTYGSWRTSGLVRGPDGNFYGTAEVAGEVDEAINFPMGLAYRVTPEGELTVLHEFAHDEDGTGAPRAPLVLASDGSLYGTAGGGGATNYPGGLFRLDLDGTFEMLHVFNDAFGGHPEWPLVRSNDGNLYGAARTGAVPGGFLYRLSLDGDVSIATVFAPVHGLSPAGELVQDGDGNLYGVAMGGGMFGDGVVYKTTPSGQRTVLHTFSGNPDGAEPQGGLVFGSDGNLYGVTHKGGLPAPGNPAGGGTIYRLTTEGDLTILHRFDSALDGRRPRAVELIEAEDGNFYGTAAYHGPNYGGTVFRLSPEGEFDTIYELTGTSPFARFPEVGLTIGPDGALYGTTSAGGEPNVPPLGGVFKVTLDGDFSVVHTFDGNDGRLPDAKLLLADDGSLYGTTIRGGANDGGSLYKVDNGTVTTLHHFAAGTQACERVDCTDRIGFNLLQGQDGALYGAWPTGGTHGYGQVYRFDASTGTFATIHSFTANDAIGGYVARVALFESSDGSIYGTNPNGGAAGLGTVFRLTENN